MNSRQSIIFNILLSCLIVLTLIIYAIISSRSVKKIPVAKVNQMMIYDQDIAYYLSTLFGSDINVSLEALPKKQIEEIVREYMIDYKILNLAHLDKIDSQREVRQQLKANREKFIKETYLNKLSRNLVTENDIQARYAQIVQEYTTGSKAAYEYRVKHILVSSKTKADNIEKELDNIFFENAAQLYSLDKATSKKGGDLGYFTEGTMVTEFEDQIKDLKIGEVSKPFQTSFGWHIVKLADKKLIPAPTYEEIHDEIESELQGRAISQYVDSIKSDLNIEVIKKDKK